MVVVCMLAGFVVGVSVAIMMRGATDERDGHLGSDGEGWVTILGDEGVWFYAIGSDDVGALNREAKLAQVGNDVVGLEGGDQKVVQKILSANVER